jgi:hypothetical protein
MDSDVDYSATTSAASIYLLQEEMALRNCRLLLVESHITRIWAGLKPLRYYTAVDCMSRFCVSNVTKLNAYLSGEFSTTAALNNVSEIANVSARQQ